MIKKIKQVLFPKKTKNVKHWYKIHKYDQSGHRKHTAKYEDLCQ